MKTLLLVDNDNTRARDVGAKLENLFSVTVVPSVKLATTAIDTCRFDAVVSALDLPDGAGSDVVRYASTRLPAAALVLTHTGNASAQSAPEADCVLQGAPSAADLVGWLTAFVPA